MKNTSIKYVFIEFVLLVVLMVLIPVVITTDVNILKNGLSELSMTEFLQSFFIFSSAVLFYKKSRSEPLYRGVLILVSGLFSMMFIREADYYLDYVYHGFWKVPALIAFSVAVYSAYKCKETIMIGLTHYQNLKAFGYVFMGFLIVVVFSRVFGTGSFWSELSSVDSSFIKTIVQEGLELFGYLFIFWGSIVLYFTNTEQES